MPLVHVYMFEGRTIDQKRELSEGITNVLCEVLGFKPGPGINVLIHDMERDSWGRGGILNSDRQKGAKPLSHGE